MFAEPANPAARERQNARVINPGAETAEKLGLSAVILMAREKSQSGMLNYFSMNEVSNDGKSQLATLSAKVQTYEEVIRKMSLRFGVSDEQLMSNAMTCVGLIFIGDLHQP